MAGETDLAVLLKAMHPVLQLGEYVFCSVEVELGQGMTRYIDLQPVGLFYEQEGLTLILHRQRAEAADLPYKVVFGLITLSIHSSLEAVGFLAAITAKLANHGISVNPVSAFYHDHLFIPAPQIEQAMQLLQSFAA
jgi:uncharacterized protein